MFNPLSTVITGKECYFLEALAQFNKDAAIRLPHTSRSSLQAS
jgi:hypothetical protein